jgi:hypothetical protein
VAKQIAGWFVVLVLKTMQWKTDLTFSWRMPLIQSNSWGHGFAQPVGGTAVRWGHNCSGREQKSESAIEYPGQDFPAFGPLVVALDKNETAGFLAG